MDLKPYNEQEFNRLCAEFLGWKQNSKKTTFYVDKNDSRHIYEIQDLKFHSNWEWIMQVCDRIEGLKEGEEVEHNWYVTIGEGNYCRIFTDEFKTFQDEIIVYNTNTKKDAVVLAIWEFLQSYNKLK
jgi:hypothetical protein